METLQLRRRRLLITGAHQNLSITDSALRTHQKSSLSKSPWRILHISPQVDTLLVQTMVLIHDIKLILATTYQHFLCAKPLYEVVYYCFHSFNPYKNPLMSYSMSLIYRSRSLLSLHVLGQHAMLPLSVEVKKPPQPPTHFNKDTME